MIWVYESHMGGGLFTELRQLTIEECRCDQCGDYDWEVGGFKSFAEFLAAYADMIDLDDGHGGYNIDDIIEDVAPSFNDQLTRAKAINIVLANRTPEDWEDDE